MPSKEVGSTVGGRIYMYLTVNETGTSIMGNTSTVEWKLQARITSAGNWYSNSYHAISVTINGSNVYSRANTTQSLISVNGTTPGTVTTIASGTATVGHNADGSKNLGIAFSCAYRWDTTYSWSASGNFNLTTIARASTPSCSNGTIGSTVTVNTNRASSSFTHNLFWKCGSKSGTIATNVGASASWKIPSDVSAGISNAAKGTVTITCDTYNGSTKIGSKTATMTASIPNSSLSISKSWIYTDESLDLKASNICGENLIYQFAWKCGAGSGIHQETSSMSHTPVYKLSGFAQYIPNSRQGVVTITLTTKRGSATVGSVSKTFDLWIPDSVKPSISGLTVTDASGCYDQIGSFLQTLSKAKVKATGSAGTGASIKSIQIKVGSEYSSTQTNASGSYEVTSSAIKASGKVACTAVITDTRGQTASKSVEIDVTAYTSPRITDLTVYRCDKNGTASDLGGYGKIAVIGYSASVQIAGEEKNVVTWSYEYRAATEDTWSIPATLSDLLGDISMSPEPLAFDTDSSYVIQITGKDKWNEVSQEIALTSAQIPIDILPNGHGAAFGKAATEEKTLDTPWNIHSTAGEGGKIDLEGERQHVGFYISPDGEKAGIYDFQSQKWLLYTSADKLQSDLGTIKIGTLDGKATEAGKADKATLLGSLGRLTSANRGSDNTRKSAVETFLATSSMTEGKPPVDAHMLQFNWDYANSWDTQLAIADGGAPHVYVRGQDNGTWKNWITLLDGSNWNNYAGQKPVYKRDVSGNWYREYLRFPDVGIQIAWMSYAVSDFIKTAWGSGYESTDAKSMGDWNAPFKDLQTYTAWVRSESDTDVWLSAYKPASTTYAGSYYLQRQSALAERRTYWIYVLGIGTY